MGTANPEANVRIEVRSARSSAANDDLRRWRRRAELLSAASPLAWSRQASTTSAPARASANAVSKPRPLLAPVTTAMRPERSGMSLVVHGAMPRTLRRSPDPAARLIYRGRMTHRAADDRYETMVYRRCGRSGIQLPLVSLGVWHNFGDARPADEIESMLTRAFDLGITHFDLANNYGPPFGSAETNVGKVLGGALAPYRDELILSTKAGWDMWPGPYGDGGSRKYLLASLDASLKRMGVEYVDIFYSHRYDHETPLEETMGALDTAVRQGKALYAGISSYPPDQTAEAAAILTRLGTPLLIHQPPYSMFNRWIENGLLDTFGQLDVGCIVFSPLAQGLLTNRYLDGIPEGSRASRPASSLDPAFVTDELRERVRALDQIAGQRGQTLAQMALAWTVRDPRVTSTLIGASSLEQLEQNVAILDKLEFSDEELLAIEAVLS